MRGIGKWLVALAGVAVLSSKSLAAWAQSVVEDAWNGETLVWVLGALGAGLALAGACLLRRGIVEGRMALRLWAMASVALALAACILAMLLAMGVVSMDQVEGLRPATRRFR